MAVNNAQAIQDANKAAYDLAVTEKTLVNSVDPPDVGLIAALMQNFVPMWERINLENITIGTVAPNDADGQEGDVYWRTVASGWDIYRKEGAVWVLKISPRYGVNYVNGIITGLRTFLSSGIVTVTPGSWAISNVIYSKATQTQFTLTAADAALTRIDLIYAGITNNVAIIIGTPGAGEPALPTNNIKIDAAIIPSVASGNAPYLESGGSDISDSFVPILGTITYPDTIQSDAFFNMTAGNASNPFFGSGSSGFASFEYTGYGWQQVYADDLPVRGKVRICSAGVWGSWTDISTGSSGVSSIVADQTDLVEDGPGSGNYYLPLTIPADTRPLYTDVLYDDDSETQNNAPWTRAASDPISRQYAFDGTVDQTIIVYLIGV